MGADASSPIDPIDTGRCVTWLGEHERAKRHHDGKHRCAVSGKDLRIVSQFGYLLDFEECETIPPLAGNQIGMDAMNLPDFDLQ
jgi:hypothetical protein